MSSHGGAKRRLSGIPRPSSRLSQGPRPASALDSRPASSLDAGKNQGAPALKSFMDVGYQATLGTRSFSIKDAPAWKSTLSQGPGLSVISGIHSFNLDAAYLGSDGSDPKLSLWDGVLIRALKRALTTRSNLLVHLTGPDNAGQLDLGDDFVVRAKTALQARSDLGPCLMRVVEIEGKSSSGGSAVSEAATCSLSEGKRGECKILGHATARKLDDWTEVGKIASRVDKESMGARQRIVHMEIHCTNPDVAISIFMIYNVESKSASPHGDANGRWAGTRTSSANENLINPLRQAEVIHIPNAGPHPDAAPGIILRKMIRPYCSTRTNVVNVVCLGRSSDQVPHTASCLRAVQLAKEAALLSLLPTAAASTGRRNDSSVGQEWSLGHASRFNLLEKENLDLKTRVKELESQKSDSKRSIELLEKRMNLMGGQLENLVEESKIKVGLHQVQKLESQITTMQGRVESLSDELLSEVEHGELMMDRIMQCQTFIARFETLNLRSMRELFADLDPSLPDVSTTGSHEVEDQPSLGDISHAGADISVSEEVLEAEMSSIPNDESSSLPADTVALPDARMVRFSPTETSTPVRGGPVSSKSRDTPYPRPSSHGQFAGSDDSNSSLSPSVESPGSTSPVPDPVLRIPTPPTLPKPGWEKRLRERQKAQEREELAQSQQSRVEE